MEDRQQELNDIVIEKEGSLNRSKKIILGAASLALLFLVILGIMKVVNSSPEKQQDAINNIPTPDTQPVPNAQKSSESNFQNIPADNKDASADERLERLINEIKQQREGATQPAPQQQVVKEEPRPAPQPAPQQPKPPVQQVVKEEPKPAPQPPKPPVQQVVKEEPKPAPQPPKPPVQQVKEEPKPAPQAPKPPVQQVKEEPKPAPQPAPATSGEYYIQVASFIKNSPDKDFLANLSKKGYTYKLHEESVNGKEFTKVLVGPYNSRESVQGALETVRKEIDAGAWIKRLK